MLSTTLLPLISALVGTTLGAPAPSELTNRATTSEIQPSALVIHDSHWSGQNTCNPGTAQVTRTNTGHDLTTMLTFVYPAAANGKQCWLDFNLPAGATVSPTGTAGIAKIDVFRQWAPVNTCPSQGNNRDVQLGRLNVPGAGKAAAWGEVYNGYLTSKAPCPAPGTVVGIEFVGVGDAETVAWQQSAGFGARILYA
ncbi:hypothetical protein QBC37DRAFT_409718 [Rhypophila decipiens]|uniref:Ubiquitin 3 binding protein But2 C-terminal domain-containing protein n=1 Tax=Rhypophila decipiens TaxID=261697 RepID=A0AAN6YII9_9PEZI|nr:hypothetical protein QBC37DRAFT_409718 [Rhypophila decipiens]